METQGPPAILIVLAFTVIFPLFFSSVVWLLGLPWRSIAATYPAPEGLQGEPIPGLHSLRVNGVNYNNVMGLWTSPQGLLLQPRFLFKVGHPRLLLPWGDLQLHPGKFLMFDTLDIKLARSPRATLKAHGGLARQLQALAHSNGMSLG